MRSQIPDDQLIMAYAERGDQNAFRQLVERHQERVYGFILGMVHDPDLARDLFQDTFMRVVDVIQRRRGSYDPRGRFLGWVLRIARNVVLDYKRSRSKWHDAAGGDEAFWDRLPDDAAPADDELHRKEQRKWLDACIARLPVAQREVLLLRQDSDLTFREIAEITNVSINTALGRMRYALINLRSMVKEQSKDYVSEGADAPQNRRLKAVAV